MNDSDRQLLLAVSGLLHYPEDDFFVQARSFEELCDLLSVVRACPLREFIRSARSKGLSRLREEHVAIFDMDSKCSLSLAWHRYGDDPAAMQDAGIAYAVEQIVDLISNGVQGIHLYTMNNPLIARRISQSVASLIRCANR